MAIELILNNIANAILYVGVLCALIFTLHYGFSPPRLALRSGIGRMFLGLGISFVAIGLVVSATLIFGMEYPGRGLVRVVGYSVTTSAVASLLVTYLVERRSPVSIFPNRKAALMSDSPNHRAEAKTSFFLTARKAFTAGFAGALTAIGTTVPLAFADGSFSAADAYVVAGAIVGGFALAFAAVYRVPNSPS